MEGVGHPRIIEIYDDYVEDNAAHADINMEGVGHPIVPDTNNDGEDEFNDAEEIMDEMMDADKEINSIREPEIQIEVTEKRKQPSLRDRRRTRSMAAAAKKTPRKERLILL